MSSYSGTTRASVILPPSSAGPELGVTEIYLITGNYHYHYRNYRLASVNGKTHTPNQHHIVQGLPVP